MSKKDAVKDSGRHYNKQLLQRVDKDYKQEASEFLEQQLNSFIAHEYPPISSHKKSVINHSLKTYLKNKLDIHLRNKVKQNKKIIAKKRRAKHKEVTHSTPPPLDESFLNMNLEFTN